MVVPANECGGYWTSGGNGNCYFLMSYFEYFQVLLSLSYFEYFQLTIIWGNLNTLRYYYYELLWILSSNIFLFTHLKEIHSLLSTGTAHHLIFSKIWSAPFFGIRPTFTKVILRADLSVKRCAFGLWGANLGLFTAMKSRWDVSRCAHFYNNIEQG